jgi:hypothetical protein
MYGLSSSETINTFSNMVTNFEKQLPTLDYFVHLQCSKRTFSRNYDKNTIYKPTNN